MELILNLPNKNDDTLRKVYINAFSSAVELFLVTAYLTEWNSDLRLNSKCKRFRIIIGKDFGITKKSACKDVMRWLPKGRKSQFLVADAIYGFHPKAIFWKDKNGKHYSLIGSSNLSKAAFESNYEANILSEISEESFSDAKEWIHLIEEQSVVISEDWLEAYVEGKSSPVKRKSHSNTIVDIQLPTPKDKETHELLQKRRKKLKNHRKVETRFKSLLSDCSKNKITSKNFYTKLPDVWGDGVGNRLQGFGFEISGKHSDFKQLSKSFIRIIQSNNYEMDDCVVEEIDRLHKIGVPTRGALLTEFLCLTFPKRYPVLNNPVKKFLSAIKFKPPRGASEGDKYIDLAKKLRSSLKQQPKHPANNLAELDIIIWQEYGE
ncbi:MAG: hypothetical protein OMM_10542 [Candidatus Magnetoglobus multicellularis str. Araruama]|uniref:Uncharacterized protein n=1 Tax=Candidatus Magnetoglobus multicellularis str. Araruama TaxID=890399 RepID=A0A1V1P0W1_9BACT|nr:MAG: hypothetical protein OMM_10542 [Candidatus Magnetoglobus multicellularis str. Araruama]